MVQKSLLGFYGVGLTMLVIACTPIVSIPVTQPPVAITVSPEETASPTLASLLPTPTLTVAPAASQVVASRPGWSTYTVPNVISFDFPNDWDVMIDVPTSLADFTGFALQPSAFTGLDIMLSRIIVDILDKEEAILARFIVPEGPESFRFYQAGESYLTGTGEGAGPTLIVWTNAIPLAGKEWNLRIRGETSSMRGYSFDGLEFLNEKGAITVGTITALQYVEEKELFIAVSQELDRDMIIALDAQGGDALFPASLPVLAGVLESISIAE